MSELFSAEWLTAGLDKEISIARNSLDRIVRDAGNSEVCVEAGLLVSLGEASAKISYLVGMLNKTRLAERVRPSPRLTSTEPGAIEHRILREESEIIAEPHPFDPISNDTDECECGFLKAAHTH